MITVILSQLILAHDVALQEISNIPHPPTTQTPYLHECLVEDLGDLGPVPAPHGAGEGGTEGAQAQVQAPGLTAQELCSHLLHQATGGNRF